MKVNQSYFRWKYVKFSKNLLTKYEIKEKQI